MEIQHFVRSINEPEINRFSFPAKFYLHFTALFIHSSVEAF